MRSDEPSWAIDDETDETVEVWSLVNIGGRDLAFGTSADEVVLVHFEEAS